MIAPQEGLDWQVYTLYGLLGDELTVPPDDVPEIALGERAFEIALARKMAAGEVETKGFERHGSTPITEISRRRPEPYRALVARRLETIEANANIAVIEKPEYKRRWNTESWADQERRALAAGFLTGWRSWAAGPSPPSRRRSSSATASATTRTSVAWPSCTPHART